MTTMTVGSRSTFLPGMVHIYVSRYQPATRYCLDLGDGKRIWSRMKPRALIRCRNCNRLRWAKHCRVQVYYDATYVSCRDKTRCKRGKKR